MEYQKIGKKVFRYNRSKAVVEFVDKATKDMYEDDNEWIVKYGHPLWNIDADGYIVLDSAGLSCEHWDDKDARIEYLTEWVYEIDAEVSYLVDDFIKYEYAGLKA